MAFVFQYSEPLRNRLIDYFQKKYGLDITPEQANEYLESLANLYDWLAENNH